MPNQQQKIVSRKQSVLFHFNEQIILKCTDDISYTGNTKSCQK